MFLKYQAQCGIKLFDGILFFMALYSVLMKVDYLAVVYIEILKIVSTKSLS